LHRQLESKTPYMQDSDGPQVIILGIDKVIKRDLGKHKELLEQCKVTLLTYREAVSHQVKKKKHYASLIGGEKFDDGSLRVSISMINIDIRAMSDKVKLTEDEIKHHTLIVDTLTEQLADYQRKLEMYNAIPARLLQ